MKLALTPSHLRFQPAVHRQFCRLPDPRVWPRILLANGWGRSRHETDGFHRRLAAVGHDSPRAHPGQPPSGPWRGQLVLCRRLFDSLPTALGSSGSPVDCVSLLDPETIRRLAEAYLVRLRALADDRAERVIDKMPENYMYLGLLARMFPAATVIHCRRDLRDVALSCWMADFRNITWANDPGHIAVNFECYLRLMNHWRTVLPITIHEVDYEEVVANLEPLVRRLFTAVGLEWDPACLDFHRTRRPIRSASFTQVHNRSTRNRSRAGSGTNTSLPISLLHFLRCGRGRSVSTNVSKAAGRSTRRLLLTPGRGRGSSRRRHPLCLDLLALSDAPQAVDDDPFVRMEIFHRSQAIIDGADFYRASLDDILTGHDEHARPTSASCNTASFRHQDGLVWCARDHPHPDGHAGQEQAIGIGNGSAQRAVPVAASIPTSIESILPRCG